VASPVQRAAGVAGGELKKRIEGIMTSGLARKLGKGKKVLLVAVAVMATAVPIAVGLVDAPRGSAQTQYGAEARAQSPTRPQFDAASVKVAEGTPSSFNLPSGRSDPGRIDYHLIGVQGLVLKAYPVEGYQVVWPAWVGNQPTFYDVSATMPAGTTKEQLQLMLQGLLADRFKLSSHWETRDLKVYALEVATSGLKIHKSEHPPDPDALYLGPYADNRGWRLTSKPSQAVAEAAGIEPDKSGYTIRQLINFFRLNLDRPFVDMTGLEGYYDIDLLVERDPPPDDGGAPSAPGSGAVGWSNSAFFSAMKKQLGLHVEKKALPTRMLVIDHLERVPTGN
jgi:uncharacterized protein (TIGR03435 family)